MDGVNWLIPITFFVGAVMGALAMVIVAAVWSAGEDARARER